MVSAALLLLANTLLFSLRLSGGGSFPKPLTSAEEREYLRRYAAGDQTARDVLIERNLRLVAHIVKKYQGIEEDPEDLISIGTIGLIKAVSTFNPAKNNRLAAYASKCVENEILMHLRSRKKCSREVSLYEPIGTDKDGNEIRLLDIMESDLEDAVEKYSLEQDIRLLYRLMRTELTSQEFQILKMRYGFFGEPEETQKVIAGKLGISRSYVSRIEKNAVEKLRRYFQRELPLLKNS